MRARVLLVGTLLLGLVAGGVPPGAADAEAAGGAAHAAAPHDKAAVRARPSGDGPLARSAPARLPGRHGAPAEEVAARGDGVRLRAPRTLHATGAALRWSPYDRQGGATLQRYEVHRSREPGFTPSAGTLVAPLPAGTTHFTDSSVAPVPVGARPQRRAYHYLVAVRTADGTLVPSRTRSVALPPAGQLVTTVRPHVVDAPRPEVRVENLAALGRGATVLGARLALPSDASPRTWDVTDSVQAWAKHPHRAHTLTPDGPGGSQADSAVSAGTAPPGTPRLRVTATEPTSSGTYGVAETPRRMTPGEQQTVPVTVTNTTGGTWAADAWVLSYRWSLPDGADRTSPSNRRETPLPHALAPGESVTLQAALRAPSDGLLGSARGTYVLSWDMRGTGADAWLSETSGIAAADVDVTVEKPTSDQLGLESFAQYSGMSTGAGSTVMVNQYSGNAVFGYDAFSNPGRGLATFLRVTYNSADTSSTPLGIGWSLSSSSLMRLGTPLDLGLLGIGYPPEVELVDGDGTGHTFRLHKNGSLDHDDWTYESPAGVHLHLEKLGGDATRRWVMTRPDRTQFFFDAHGYQTATVDGNGNEMRFTYRDGLLSRELVSLTDATGRQTLTFDYYEPGEAYDVIRNGERLSLTNLTNTLIQHKLQSVTDVSGRTVTFTYTDEGLLAEIVDGAGTAGAKTFGFGYDDDRPLGDVKLTSVTDPRGGTSHLAYGDPHGGRLEAGRAQVLTDRKGETTDLDYADADGGDGNHVRSTVTDANGHASTYLLDGYGRALSMTNAKQETTTLGWDADNNVTRLQEANGALTTWAYDPKTGYPLEMTDAQAREDGDPAMTLAYHRGLDGYVADLVEKTSPEGRRWHFSYDASGNLLTVTDPLGTASAADGDYTTRYTYDEHGQMLEATDANGNATRYADFGGTGYPQTITDPLGHESGFDYDVLGNVVSTTDAAGSTRTFSYDTFGRPLRTKVPKDAENGEYVVTPGAVYDENDNITRMTAANGAVTTTRYDAVDQMVSVTSPKDSADAPAKTSTFAYDPVGNLLRETRPKGALTSDPDDFVTRYSYDAVDQMVGSTDALGHRTTQTFDDVGNVVRVVDPRKNETQDPDDATVRYRYDLDHRVTRTTDAAGHSAGQTYDADGNVVTTTDEAGATTRVTLDEREMPVAVRQPYREDGGDVEYRTTRFAYDEVGNRTRVVTPRGVATPDEPDDFTTTTVYDELNRVKKEILPFDPDDSRYDVAHEVRYSYDAVGDLASVSAPPSQGQSVRNTTRYRYFDNGWMRRSTDPWDITTSYEYNDLGQQTKRTLTSAGGSSSRTMTWRFTPDGKLESRSDDGVPVGRYVVVVDNSDSDDVDVAGDWATSKDHADQFGYDYRTHPPQGSGDATFTWKPLIPADGTYEVFVRSPEAQATDATYTIEHDDGTATESVDQSERAGQWQSLGSYEFTADDVREITLSADANGSVAADAVKLVRDNSAENDDEQKDFAYTYDANDNIVGISDASSGALVDDYGVTYDALDRATKVTEAKDGDVEDTTTFDYDPNGNLLGWDHGDQSASYTYDVRDLVSKVTNTGVEGDETKTTAFAYTPRAQLDHQVNANENTVDYSYFLDGSLRHQVEKKSGGEVVNEHTLTYDTNGLLHRDDAHVMDADDHGTTLDTVSTYSYDPRDRVTKVAKTGDSDTTESYVNDANSNVVSKTLDDVTTTSRYDRNRLVSASTDDVTSTFDYDPFGRLQAVSTDGELTEKYVYDGFDRTAEHEMFGPGDATSTETSSYDPLDRTVRRRSDPAGSDAKTTRLHYLGLAEMVLSEDVDGQLRKSYQYSADGERLSQVTYDEDGEQEDSYYGYNAHADVEAVTGSGGNTQATYGYSAYGEDDDALFTGADKPGGGAAEEPFNVYRYGAQRWDSGSGAYDMGFRDYDPGLNRYLLRDSYNGALADLGLSTDPFTMNRYSFGGGNPVSMVDLDGHWPSLSDIGHAALDVAGLVPVVGEVADLANAGWYAAEGNYVDAGLSLAGAIPFAGWGATAVKAGKYAVKGADAVNSARKTAKALPSPKRPKVGGSKPKAKDTSSGSPNSPPAKPDAPAAAKPQPKAPDGPSCTPNSFAGDTRVLMADGSSTPIRDVEAGDRVLATDPQTGLTGGRTVAEVITGHGTKHLVEVGVDVDGGTGDATGTLVATDEHPFWVTGTGWTDAEDLVPGDLLRTSSGTYVQVEAVRAWTAQKRVHNLSVEDLHTYYVLAGGTAVLVHNTSCPVHRTPDGRFAKNPNAPPKPAPSMHGNSRASTAKNYLYVLEDASGGYLKTGITQNPAGRYSSRMMATMGAARMRVLTSGSRSSMLDLERFMVERWPGPLNREPHAGSMMLELLQ